MLTGDYHYRNTMKTARFFGVDARAALSVLLLLVHFRHLDVCFLPGHHVVFWFLEYKGLSFSAALRRFRLWVVGYSRLKIGSVHAAQSITTTKADSLLKAD